MIGIMYTTVHIAIGLAILRSTDRGDLFEEDLRSIAEHGEETGILLHMFKENAEEALLLSVAIILGWPFFVRWIQKENDDTRRKNLEYDPNDTDRRRTR